MKWSAGDGKNKGTGTSGLNSHITAKDKKEHNEAMKVLGTKEERNAAVAAADGEDIRKMKTIVCMVLFLQSRLYIRTRGASPRRVVARLRLRACP